MKIQTILEIIDTKVDKRESDKVFRSRGDNIVTQRQFNSKLKSGAYGAVSNTQDPHIISKTNHKAQPRDGYAAYMEWLITNKVYESNPAAPRIYSYKKVVDAVGHFRYVVKMEKLIPLTELEDDLVISLLERMAPKAMSSFPEGITVKKLLDWRETPQRIISKELKSAETGDKNFNTLMNQIKERFDGEFYIDIHLENVMVRLSPYPQLVITDPAS